MAKVDIESGALTADRIKKNAAENRMLKLFASFLGLQVMYHCIALASVNLWSRKCLCIQTGLIRNVGVSAGKGHDTGVSGREVLLLCGERRLPLHTHISRLTLFCAANLLQFLVFENRVFALALALVIVMYNRYNAKVSTGEAPLYAYIPSSLSNSISSWSQYEALKYVSFPSQVLSKSCKIIPVMLVGILVNHKSYPLLEYVEALLISSGATVFTLFGKSSAVHGANNADSYVGICLLLCYLFCDSFTSQWQSRVYKKHGIDQYQMMLGVNFWSIVLTGKEFNYNV